MVSIVGELAPEDQSRVRQRGTSMRIAKSQGLFNQGDAHTGVWIIESGRIRTFYAGPSGREITLAYWTAGHFVGGPEVFGTGRHIRSADAPEDCTLLFLSGTALRGLVTEIPAVALAVIDGLVAKGKSYAALIQMLGTRSVSERLCQFILVLGHVRGRTEGDTVVFERAITFEQIATVVGATRQWVTQSLDKLQREGILRISHKEIVILDHNRLRGPG